MIEKLKNWFFRLISPFPTVIIEEPVFGWARKHDITAGLHCSRDKIVVTNKTIKETLELDISEVNRKFPMSIGELSFGFDTLLRTTITIPIECLGENGEGETVAVKLVCIDFPCTR